MKTLIGFPWYLLTYFVGLGLAICSDPVVTHLFIASAVLGIFTHWWIGVVAFFMVYTVLGTATHIAQVMIHIKSRSGS